MLSSIDRAKQFLSYDALSGYKNLINKTNFKNNRDSLKILSDENLTIESILNYPTLLDELSSKNEELLKFFQTKLYFDLFHGYD